jgi:hypothetical protein
MRLTPTDACNNLGPVAPVGGDSAPQRRGRRKTTQPPPASPTPATPRPRSSDCNRFVDMSDELLTRTLMRETRELRMLLDRRTNKTLAEKNRIARLSVRVSCMQSVYVQRFGRMLVVPR